MLYRNFRPTSASVASSDAIRALLAAAPPLSPELRNAELPTLRLELEAIYGANFDRCPAISEHVAHLPANEQLTELEQLLFARTVGIHGPSDLFREPFSLRAIKQVLLPAIATTPVKIASIGCAAGEEPLSILIDNWVQRDRLQIQGLDINPLEIKRTQDLSWFIDCRGYTLTAPWIHLARDTYATIVRPETWREAFDFELCNAAQRIVLRAKPEARDRIAFKVHDIVSAPLAEQVDIIILQNVLCHLAPKGRDLALKNIQASLAPGGYFVGDAGHTLRYAAPDPAAFENWYESLASERFRRVPLMVTPHWMKKPISESASLYVFQVVAP